MPATPAIRQVLTLLLLQVVLGVTGCAPEEDANIDDGANAMTTEEATPKLTAQYGVRPRRYEGYFNASNEAEHAFSLALREATTFLRQRIAERRADFTVDEAELATNILSEGLGFYVLEPNQLERISGFGALGIDTIVDSLPAYTPWLHPDVLAHVRPENIERAMNEKSENVQSLKGLSVRLGVLANAGLYAWFKSRVAADFAASGKRLSNLPTPGQVFWGTLYFNSGAGNGKATLAKNGADYYRQKWTRADDFTRYATVPQYNALWRTASYELLTQTVFAGGTREVPEGRPMGAAGTRRDYLLTLRKEGDVDVAELTVDDWGKLASVHLVVEVDPSLVAPIPAKLTTGSFEIPSVTSILPKGDGTAEVGFSFSAYGAARPWKLEVRLPPEARADTLKLVYILR